MGTVSFLCPPHRQMWEAHQGAIPTGGVGPWAQGTGPSRGAGRRQAAAPSQDPVSEGDGVSAGTLLLVPHLLPASPRPAMAAQVSPHHPDSAPPAPLPVLGPRLSPFWGQLIGNLTLQRAGRFIHGVQAPVHGCPLRKRSACHQAASGLGVRRGRWSWNTGLVRQTGEGHWLPAWSC